MPRPSSVRSSCFGARKAHYIPESAAALAAAFPNAESLAIAEADHTLIVQKPGEVAADIAEYVARRPM